MRRWLTALLLLAAVATPARAGMWLTGSAVNPTANQVIVTTGALQAQTAQFVVFVFASVATSVAVERLTAGAVVKPNDSVTFTAPAQQIVQLPLGISFEEGDTFRLRVVTGVTGTVAGFIRFNDGDSSGYCLVGLGCAH